MKLTLTSLSVASMLNPRHLSESVRLFSTLAGSKPLSLSLQSLLHLHGGGDGWSFRVLYGGDGGGSSLAFSGGGAVFSSEGGGLVR
jgi:hypothetical protein